LHTVKLQGENLLFFVLFGEGKLINFWVQNFKSPKIVLKRSSGGNSPDRFKIVRVKNSLF